MPLTIELKVLRSLTTEVDFFLDNQTLNTEAVEFTEKALFFQLPKSKLAVGTLVILQCSLHFEEQTADFPANARVQSCDISDSNLMRVGFELRQFDKGLWTRFTTVANDKQARVEKIFASMKGEVRGR